VSYILEALRKAERDRQVSRTPTLATTHAAPESGRRRLWVWGVAGGVALSAIVVYGYIRLAGDADAPLQTALPPATAAGPAVPGAGIAVVTAPTPTEQAPEREEPAPAHVPGPTVERPPTSRAPTPPRVVPRPTAPRVARPATAPRREPSPVAPSAAPESRRAAVVAPSPAPPPAASGRRPVTEPRPAADPVTPAAAARPAADPVPPATVARPAADPVAPAAVTRPAPPPPDAAAGPALPRLALDVLVYSDVPAERMVFINGRKYIEGQTVDDDTVIEQITPEGVVIRHQGRRLELRPKLNPYARPGSS
jgi:general secretion pathway protein B